MGFYSERILPYLLDFSLSDPTLGEYRRQTLAQVSGQVLEIGFGTGLNLSYYPDAIRQIVTVDPNPGVHRLAEKRIAQGAIAVDHHILGGETLPMDNHTFDSVVSTFTLCSIPRVDQALGEIYRVLKPGGRFFFMEHGLSPEPGVQAWQHRLTPLQKRMGDGCHLDRNIQQLVEQQFDTVAITADYAKPLPRIVGYLYRGVATKQAS
ncbi:MAG: class I SAM-dependent methyltransferase [Leptolyngbya sp. LCM1.Bin17]|nr:MAG: class I SAM-dependent methyltransferase [Leptolyngbya sp. LCM1.Bin17]